MLPFLLEHALLPGDGAAGCRAAGGLDGDAGAGRGATSAQARELATLRAQLAREARRDTRRPGPLRARRTCSPPAHNPSRAHLSVVRLTQAPAGCRPAR